MKEEMDDIELIRRYLTEELSPDSLKDVEKRIQGDAKFKEEVEMHQVLGDGLKTLHADHLKDKLKDWEEELNSLSSLQNTKSTRPYFAIAAAITLLMAASITIYLFTKSDISNQELYQAYLTDFEPDIFVRGNEVVLDSAVAWLNSGFAAIKIKDFSSALHSFQKVATDYNLDSLLDSRQRANLFIGLGVANLNLDNLSDAETNFQSVLDNELYAEYGQWYLALLYLKNDKVEKAQSMLDTIATDPNNFFFNRAQKLRSELK